MTRIQTFDYTLDLRQAILWQYDRAARLVALLDQKQAWYDAAQAGFWSNWAVDVFDLRTANDFGLSVWALILNLPLLAYAPSSGARPVFGFGAFNRNFFDGTFGRDTSAALGLTTEQRRLALRLRYFQLIARGTVPQTNVFLADLFGDQGLAYVQDNLDMTVTYVFDFVPDASVLYVLEQFDLLPRPAGVEASVLV